MFRKLFFYFLLFSCTQVSWSQQVLFHKPNYHAPPGFAERYTERYSGYAELNARGTFKLKQVRKINIYNRLDSLVYFFELDRNGKTIEEGYRGNYYFRTLRRTIDYQDTFECRIWRKGRLIIRKDTSEIYHKTYRNADTLMEYDEYNITIYKRGNLINEQNRFYSLHYLNHSGSFKEDYDTTVLYMCSRNNYRSNFSASVKDRQINLDTSSIKQHPFYKKYRRPFFQKQFVEGEEFIEPTQRSAVFCGTTLPSPEPYQTLNENGLFDKHYSDEIETRLVFYAKYEYYEKP